MITSIEIEFTDASIKGFTVGMEMVKEIHTGTNEIRIKTKEYIHVIPHNNIRSYKYKLDRSRYDGNRNKQRKRNTR